MSAFVIGMMCFVLMWVGCLFLYIRQIRERSKILRLKKFFLFSIDVFTGVVIAMASGDKDAIKEWSEDQIKRLNCSKNYLPKKSEVWYFLAKEALCNKASDRLDTALGLIKQGNYSHALDVLAISNKEIMEYEVIKR